MGNMVWGIARVKDELDIIATTVRWMLTQVDYVLVQDNDSHDGTRDALAELAAEHSTLLVCDDLDIAYYQSRKMSALAAEAARMGAGWVVPFDADEVWTAPNGHLGDWLRGLQPDHAVAGAALFDHVVTSWDLADIADPVQRIGWRRADPAGLLKVAARTTCPVTIHQGNHDASFDHVTAGAGMTVHHYPYRSVEQFTRKVRNGAAAYAATDLPEDIGQHWRDYGRLTDQGLREVFETWHSVQAQFSDQPALVWDPPIGHGDPLPA